MNPAAAVVERVLDAPPPACDLLTFARRLRLPLDGGPSAGQLYDPDSHPVQREVLRAIGENAHQEYVVLGPVQDGKSWCTTIVPTLWALVEHRANVAYGLPDRNLCAAMWDSKMRPTFAGSGMAHLLPTAGRGSDGGIPSDLLIGGWARLFLIGAGARNEAGQALRTAKFAIVDERDSIRPRWAQLIFQRTAGWDDQGRRISTTTIKHDRRSPTVVAYESGTAGRLWVCCPLCGHPQTLEWTRVRYSGDTVDAVRASAAYHCAACDQPWQESQRRFACLGGVVAHRGQTVDATAPDRHGVHRPVLIGTAIRVPVWSVRWTSLDSPRRSLADVCLKHHAAQQALDASGSHDLLRQFWRDHLTTGYLGDEQDDATAPPDMDAPYLATRSAVVGWSPAVPDMDPGKLWSRFHAAPPPDAAGVVLAVDVQLNRLYWGAVALGPQARTDDLAWGYECTGGDLPPLGPGDIARLLDRIEADAATWGLPILARVVDTGYESDDAAAAGADSHSDLELYLRAHAGRWAGIRGIDNLPRSAAVHVPGLLAWDATWRPGLGRWLVSTGAAIGLVHAGYRLAATAPGAARLPRGLPPNHHYIRHLVARVQTADGWLDRSRRRDWLHCRAYATAIARAAAMQTPAINAAPAVDFAAALARNSA